MYNHNEDSCKVLLGSCCYSIRTAGLGRMIRTGNAMALDAVRPQMAVHYNPRADN